jgi:mono/diheme cytochrome c family protein
MARAIFQRRNLAALALIVVSGLLVVWVVTRTHPLSATDIPAHTANLENGKTLYNAGGCISCHAPGPELKEVGADVPAGGKPFKTPIGILYPPNLTSDSETGLGNWTETDFVNAMQKGISPAGEHLIPAFPYTSYAHMKMTDVLDIKAYLATMAPVKNPAKPHEIPLAMVIRRGLGLWKYIGFDEAKWQPDPAMTESWNRGSYLVNGPGHCNECHTPRTIFMANDNSRKFMGGPHPEGKGKVPSLLSLIERGRYKDMADLVLAFQNGEELGYTHMSSGGMGDVQSNIAKLPEADVKAIAEYVTSLK